MDLSIYGAVITAAILAETAWQILKELMPSPPAPQFDRLGVIIICIFFAISGKLDLVALHDISMAPLAGQIVTGLIMSRGANFFHDFMSSLK